MGPKAPHRLYVFIAQSRPPGPPSGHNCCAIFIFVICFVFSWPTWGGGNPKRYWPSHSKAERRGIVALCPPDAALWAHEKLDHTQQGRASLQGGQPLRYWGVGNQRGSGPLFFSCTFVCVRLLGFGALPIERRQGFFVFEAGVGNLWTWLQLMCLQCVVLRGPVGVVWGHFWASLGPSGL